MSRVGDPPHGIEASQDHDDKQKREERREEREERREKKEYTPQEPARGPQMRPPEVPTRGTDPSLHHAAPQSVVDRRLESLHFKGGSWLRRKNPSRICSRHGLALSASSGGMEESRKKRGEREERREQMAASSIHCIFTVPRDHLEKVQNIRNGHPNIFTAYLRCPVTTSKSAQKYFSSLLPKV